MFRVEGGEFTDTDFKKLVPETAENYGPFETYEEALKVWGGRTWAKVDVCCHRLMIKEA